MKNFIASALDRFIFRESASRAPAKAKKETLKIHPVLPHNDIGEVLDNIWFVRGQVRMPMLFPPLYSERSMTIVKNPDTNELTLINTLRLNEDGLRALDAIGKVTQVLRIAGFHGRDDAFYRERYQAKIYALEGHVYTREMMKPVTDPDAGYLQPDVWLKPGDLPPLPNAELKWFPSCSPAEALLVLKQDGGTLISGDSLQHTPAPTPFHNWASKLMMKKMDFFKPYNVGPGWVEFAHPSLEEIRSIMCLDFENVLPGHGTAVIGGAKEKFRASVMGDIKGCHVD